MFLAIFSERRLNSPVAVPVIFQSIFVQMTSNFLRFVKGIVLHFVLWNKLYVKMVKS